MQDEHTGPLRGVSMKDVSELSGDLNFHIDNVLNARTRILFKTLPDDERKSIDEAQAAISFLMAIGSAYVDQYGLPEPLDDRGDEDD